MNIEFISVCYNFQRRMMCFLSSLLQQTYRPNITINLAYIKNNGSPSTENIVNFYQKQGLNFRLLPFDDVRDIAYRAKIRNEQIAKSKAAWLFFYDVDQILPPDFFEKWCKVLGNKDCIYGEKKKIFTQPEATQSFIDSLGCIRYLPSAFPQVSRLPTMSIRHPKVVSGGLMLMRRKLLYKVTDGEWGDPSKDRHFFKQMTFSDPVFRRKFKVSLLEVAPVIHMGHSSWGDYKVGKFLQQ